VGKTECAWIGVQVASFKINDMPPQAQMEDLATKAMAYFDFNNGGLVSSEMNIKVKFVVDVLDNGQIAVNATAVTNVQLVEPVAAPK